MSNYRGDKRDIHEILLSDDEFPDECVDTPDIPAYLIDDRFDEISFPWLDNMKVKHFDKDIPYVSDGDDEEEEEGDDEDEEEEEDDDEDGDNDGDDDEEEEESKPKACDPFDDEDSNTDERKETNYEKEKSSPPDMKESNSVSEKLQNERSVFPSTSQETGTNSYVSKNDKGIFATKNKKGYTAPSVQDKDCGRVYNALPGLIQSNPCYQTTLIYEGYLMQSDLICLEYYEKYAYNDDCFVWTVNHFRYKSIMRQYHFFPGVLVPDMYCNYTPHYNSAPVNGQRQLHYSFGY